MVEKKKFCLSFVLAILLIIFCAGFFVGCANNPINKLTNEETGIVVKGGKFEKGSELSVEEYAPTSQAGQEALTRIASYSYSTTHDPIIYDIKVTKDDATVQPNGAITITMNAPYESTKGFVVFHIIDESTIETPEVTYANGKISFSVTHFSVFIVAEDEESGELSVHYDDEQGTVKFENGSVMPKDYSVTLKGVANIKLTAEAKNGYKFIGWYKGNSADAELITNNATAYFTRFNTIVYARFEENAESNFIFKLEMELNEENNDVVKTVEYYTTGEHDGKSAEWEIKVNGEPSDGVDTTLSADPWYAGVMIKSSTAYKNCDFGTIDQQFGLLDGYHTHDGHFGGKITINPNYKLFWVQELQASTEISTSVDFRAKLIPVEADKMQVLNEGQYIVIRTDVYENALTEGLNNENGDLCEAIANLIRPKDNGNGPEIADISAAYVFSIQFDNTLKNS